MSLRFYYLMTLSSFDPQRESILFINYRTSNIKNGLLPFFILEVRVGIEPTHGGFANRSVTASPSHQIFKRKNLVKISKFYV